jgi:hypothetical protein
MARHQRVQRIAAAVLQCLRPAVWVLWVTGIAAFLLLPLAAKRCYLDEKALLVGGALPTIRCAEGRQGLHRVGRQRQLAVVLPAGRPEPGRVLSAPHQVSWNAVTVCRQSGALDACVSANNQLQTQLQQGDLAALVQAAAAAAGGLQLYRQNYTSGSGQQCSTLHSVVRSPRGDGSEGFVLLMPLDSSNRAAAALAAAAGMALAGHLRGSRWLAKDAVLVFTDAACGTVESADVSLWTCSLILLQRHPLLHGTLKLAQGMPPSLSCPHLAFLLNIPVPLTSCRSGWPPTTAVTICLISPGRGCCSRHWFWSCQARQQGQQGQQGQQLEHPRRRQRRLLPGALAQRAQQSSACTAAGASCPIWTFII